MGIAAFQIKDKLDRARFFQETFLLVNTSMKVILRISFFILSNVNIQFAERKLIWKSYTAKKALPTTWRIKLINKKKFAKAPLDKNIEVFVVHVSFLSQESKITIHPAQEAQIASLLAKEITVPAKYSDFADVFSKESAEVLPKRTKINEHAIKLEDSKQPPYRPIYSLGPIELETLKTYIEIKPGQQFHSTFEVSRWYSDLIYL